MKSRIGAGIILTVWSWGLYGASGLVGAQAQTRPASANSTAATRARVHKAVAGKSSVNTNQTGHLDEAQKNALKTFEASDYHSRLISVRLLSEAKVPARIAMPLMIRDFRASLIPEAKTPNAQQTEQAAQFISYRYSILATLSEYGPEARPALPLLISVMRDPKAETELRSSVARTLGDIGIGSPDVVAALVGFLPHPERSPLTTIVPDALAQLGSSARSAIPALEAELMRPDTELRNEFYRASVFEDLGQIAAADTNLALAAHLRRLQKWKTLPLHQLAASLHVIGASGRNAQAAVPMLVEIGRERNDDYLASAAISTLAQTGAGDNEAAGRLVVITLLRSNSPQEADGATELATQSATLTLHQAQADDIGLIAPILAVLPQMLAEKATDSPNQLRNNQIERETALLGALAQIGPEAKIAINVLTDRLLNLSLPTDASFPNQQGAPPSYQDAHHRDLVLRLNLYAALIAIGLPSDPARRAALVQCIKSDLNVDPAYPGARLAYVGAARTAGALTREEAAPLVPALIRLLAFPSQSIPSLVQTPGGFVVAYYQASTTSPEIEAARTLGKLGVVATPALPALEALTQQTQSSYFTFDIKDVAREAITHIEAERKQPKT